MEQHEAKEHTKSSAAGVNVAQKIVTKSKVITAGSTNTTSSISFLPTVSAGPFNSSVSFASSTLSTSSAILTAINANQTKTVTPLKGSVAGATHHLVTPITLNTDSSQADKRQSSLLSSVSSSNQQLLKSPASTPLDPSILIDNLASDIFLDASYDTDDPTAGDSKSELKLKLETQHLQQTDPAVTTLVIKPYGEDANVDLGLGQATVKKEDLKNDSKDSLIMVPAATISSATAMPTGSSMLGGTSGNDDDLGIVPIEKAMQMVQESIRPRKEQLRKRFGELLDLCLTQSDIELVEKTMEQLISTNLLQ